MAFDSQFSLSLELTRLLPMKLITNEAVERVMTLARDLRKSGSDIVVEEDLARTFGRMKIMDTMSSTFRTVIARSQTSYTLTDYLTLESGPGPTVTRSLVQGNGAYFATVLQCSFLTAVHNRSALAAALAYTFEKEAESAPVDVSMGPTLSQEGIEGVLRACEDQTAAFDWTGLLRAAALSVNCDELEAAEPLPSAIFRGALVMFAMVQTLPEDRKILVTMHTSGLPTFIVWAHHICGLRVQVRQSADMLYDRETIIETMLGSGEAQVIVEYGLLKDDQTESSITLLEAQSNSRLFTFATETEEPELTADFKIPARGYGLYCIERLWKGFVGGFDDDNRGKKATFHELIKIVIAYAMLIAKHTCVRHDDNPVDLPLRAPFDAYKEEPEPQGPPSGGIDSWLYGDAHKPQYRTKAIKTPSASVLEASELLFEDQNLQKVKYKRLISLYDGVSMQSLGVPESIEEIADELGWDTSNWEEIVPSFLSKLVAIVLAFANVKDLSTASGLPLCDRLDNLGNNDIVHQILNWKQNYGLEVTDWSFFEVLTSLTVGHDRNVTGSNLRNASLISESGWSVYLSTVTHADPSSVDWGMLVIREGVPCRNNVRKHSIVDAPLETIPTIRKRILSFDPGEPIRLFCGNRTTGGKPLCGEKADSFVVSPRIHMEQDKLQNTRRTGYSEMHRALSMVINTKPCSHKVTEEELILSADCGALAIQGEEDPWTRPEKTVVCLTAFNKAARWRALLSIALRSGKLQDHSKLAEVVLRDQNTCLSCAIKRANKCTPRCFLIL